MLFIQLRPSPKFETCWTQEAWPIVWTQGSDRPWECPRALGQPGDQIESLRKKVNYIFLRYFVSKRYLSERWRGRRSKHRRWGEIQRQRLPPSDVHPGRVHVQPKQWCWAHCGWPRPCSPWRGSSPWRAGSALWIRWWGSVVRHLGTVWHSFEWHGVFIAHFLRYSSSKRFKGWANISSGSTILGSTIR